MDAQSLELTSGLPFLRPRRTAERQADRTDAGGPDPGRSAEETSAGVHTLLIAYTAACSVLGLAALAWTTLAIPLLPMIDPGLPGTALAGPEGGLLLWIAFGLVGSLRVLPIPGSSAVWTFHFPFVAAAMVLGGPTAGAWVGFLATVERRELESQPWYGVLANHAVMAFAVGGNSIAVGNTLGGCGPVGRIAGSN